MSFERPVGARGHRLGVGALVVAATLGLHDSAKADPCFGTQPAPTGSALSIFEAAKSRARSRDWRDATTAFRAVALEHSGEAFAMEAAKEYLESASQLGRVSDSKDCFDQLARDLPRLTELYCRSSPSELCARIDTMGADLERLAGQALVQRADQARGMEGRALYEAGAKAYAAGFHKRCEVPVDDGKTSSTSHCDELAYNAAQAFRAAGLAPEHIDALNRLIRYDTKTRGQSPLSKKALLEIGRAYHSLAIYDLAADHYERYVTSYPTDLLARDALTDAIVLRLGSGDEPRGSADVSLFVRLYGATQPARTAQIVLALASHDASHSEWTKTDATLSGPSATALFARAPLDLRIQAAALLAQAHAAGPPEKRAASVAEYGAVLSLWGAQRPAEAAIASERARKTIDAAWPEEDEAMHLRRLGRTLNAVGEALFARADARRVAEVDAVRPPLYKGPLTEAAMRRHLETAVVPWIRTKRLDIEGAEARYAEVLALQPMPPPRWVVDSTAAVAAMLGTFADEVTQSLPASAVRRGKTKTPIGVALDEAASGLRIRAAAAAKACLDMSAKYLYVDERTRACESWLVRYRDLARRDELVPTLRSASPLTYPPLPSH